MPPEEIDWFLLNPVMEGYISYADLKNGSLNLYDMYILNKAIMKKQETMEEEARRLKRKMAIKGFK